MNWNQLFNLKGVNMWLIAVGIGWNLLWAFFLFTVSYLVLSQGEDLTTAVQLVLLVGAFLGPFMGGWFIGRIAGDNRGPTYGGIGSLSGVLLMLLVLLPSGILGLMAAFVALAGGLNGGMLSRTRR